jgi:lipoprotein NlpD
MVLSSCSNSKYNSWSSGSKYFENDNNAALNRNPTFIGSCPNLYIVKYGDTLSGIAQKCGLRQVNLARINQLDSPYWLREGQKLKLFSSNKSLVKKSRYVFPKKNFIWPVKNKINYKFIKDATGNSTLIIKAQRGTPVYAVADGKVVYSGGDIKEFGKMIILKHRNGYLTLYAHNNNLKVKEGQKVKQKQIIATIGLTGEVKESQLLFEVRYKGKKVDAKKSLK